jgi:excisionase family DNA binding protein
MFAIGSDMPEYEDLLKDGLTTVAEAAKFLSLGRSTLYELMDNGELRYVKIGSSRRIPKRALMELAKTNLQGGWAIAL